MVYRVNIALSTFLLLFMFNGCSVSGDDESAITALFLQPVITSVEPQVGHPEFTLAGETFGATDVIIRGRSFSSVIVDNIVHFAGVQATVLAATDTEITAVVPPGTTTGVLSYANAGMGGACNEGGGRYGLYCSSSDFYVNCYLPYENRYDTEYEVVPLEEITITFDNDLEVRAFKVDVEIAPKTVEINCPANVSVSLFSPSCGVTYLFNQPTPLQFSVATAYTAQFFVQSAVAGDCTLTAY